MGFRKPVKFEERIQRLLRIPRGFDIFCCNSKFTTLRQNERATLRGKLWTHVVDGIAYLYSTVGEPVSYLAGRYDCGTTVREMQTTVNWLDGPMAEADRSYAESLQLQFVSVEEMKQRESSDCPICQGSMETGVLFNCGHLMHGRCLREYLSAQRRFPRCPLCRASLLSAEQWNTPRIDLSLTKISLLMWTAHKRWEESCDPSSKYWDIGYLQSLACNRGATFLLPCGANGLVPMPPVAEAEGGSGLAAQTQWKTPASMAALSAASGLVLRTCFATENVSLSAKPDSFEFLDASAEVNLLDRSELEEIIRLDKNGRLEALFNYSQTKVKVDAVGELYRHIKLVRHDFIQVTYGRLRDVPGEDSQESFSDAEILETPDDSLLEVQTDPFQIVNQVCGVSEAIIPYESCGILRPLVVEFYKAQIIGAIIAAKSNSEFLSRFDDCVGRNRLFLCFHSKGYRQDAHSVIEALLSPEVFPYLYASQLEIFVIGSGSNSEIFRNKLSELSSGTLSGFHNFRFNVEFLRSDQSIARLEELFRSTGLQMEPKEPGFRLPPPADCPMPSETNGARCCLDFFSSGKQLLSCFSEAASD